MTLKTNWQDNDDVTASDMNAICAAINSNTSGKQNVSEKGQGGGYCPLDGAAVVPDAHIPTKFDQILEYANLAGFPSTGEVKKLYIDKSTDRIYRWTGASYAQLTYRPNFIVAATGSQITTLPVNTQVFVFTGSSATTWGLPTIAGNTGVRFVFKNRGSDKVTLTPAGDDEIFTTTAVSTLELDTGDSAELINDGTYWVVV